NVNAEAQAKLKRAESYRSLSEEFVTVSKENQQLRQVISDLRSELE
ncbi:MAG: putative nucleic acid-binding Zn-ribbon protein, partial [Candidatus Omnitrophota bacterium]